MLARHGQIFKLFGAGFAVLALLGAPACSGASGNDAGGAQDAQQKSQVDWGDDQNAAGDASSENQADYNGPGDDDARVEQGDAEDGAGDQDDVGEDRDDGDVSDDDYPNHLDDGGDDDGLDD